MYHKLKYLKAYWNRVTVPSEGANVGKIIYTSKNTTGRRNQIVLDVDNNMMDITTIDASPADPTTYPGEIVIKTIPFAPKNDNDLYIFGAIPAKPTITNSIAPEYTQTIIVADTITPVDITSTIVASPNGVGLVNDFVISVITENGLTLNTTTGEVTLDDNMTPGVYTVKYKVEHSLEPSVYILGYVKITVEEAP